MGDGAFKPNTTMLGSLPENTMDFGLIDELLIDGFWLETTDDSNFWQPGPSTYLDNSSSFYSQTSDINITHFNSNLNQASFSEEEKHSNLTDNRYPIHIQGDQVVAEQSPKKESILHSASTNHSKSFLVEGTEMNRRLWIGPNRNLTPNALVRSRLVQAIEYLKDSTRDKDVLIQLWVPVKRGGKKVLTTNNQPFSFNPNHKSLAEYRHVSKNYQFALEEDSKEFLGLPGRVFLKKLPEWTPDVRFFKREEYPRVNHAQQYNIGGSIALPVFERGSGACLGVVEIISTSQMLSHRPELESVCKALEAVDLKSSDISVPPEAKDCNESYRVALAEIKDVLQCVCDLHKLPLAQTWVPCNQQGKGGCRHSDETYADCVSTVDSACYVRDPQVWEFHVACSEHHLLKGEGVAGGAFTTNQPCFATDITAFSKTEYPLSHHAKLFHFCAAVAVRLRSIYTGSADFVLEFFLPLDCRDAESQKQMLNSLSLVIQQICRSLRVVTDQELKEEVAPPTVKRKFSSGNKFDKEESPASISPSKKSSQDASSWIAMATSMGDEGKGKGLAFSLDSHKKEAEGGEFKLTPYWDKNPPELHQMPSITDHTQIQQSSGLRENASGSCEYSLTREHHHYSGTRRASERRRTKTEKTISLQVLRQYFAGSLKDAAKSIGVCPTTLKRICRQHGITRWPSRKIKKVGHSLKKLQLVIDSVQGAEGSIQLSSFYNNFPQLSSTSLASPSQLPSNTSDDQQKLSPATTASKSPSSSASHSSSSSFCCSVGATQSNFPVNSSSVKDDSSAEQCIETLKRAHSDAELQNMVQGGTKLLVRSQSHKILPQDVSLEPLPPLPTKASNQLVQDGSTLRVKAAFGDEKIRFSIQPNWGFETLLQEVRRRFNIDDANRIDLKYLDDDSEWVLLTCDADLEECIDIHKSSRSRTIKLSLNLPYHRNLPGSFGSRVLS